MKSPENKSIVLVEAHRNEVWADSALVARKFGMRHRELVAIIKCVLEDFPDLRGSNFTPLNRPVERHYTEERHYRGQPYTAYMMNLPFFTLVAGRLPSKKAREWQREFNRGFHAMADTLTRLHSNKSDPAWIADRSASKQVRKELMSVAEQFVRYCEAAGSKNAGNYRGNITKATYKALELIVTKHPNFRDTLESMDLIAVASAEMVAQDKLLSMMEANIEYHDLYKRFVVEMTDYCAPLVMARKRRVARLENPVKPQEAA